MINLMTKPRWCLGMLGTQRRSFGNIVGHASGVSDLSSLSAWTTQQFDPSLNWNDVEWIKKRWGGKLILKGILDADDARRAADFGADAIIVSKSAPRTSTPASVGENTTSCDAAQRSQSAKTKWPLRQSVVVSSSPAWRSRPARPRQEQAPDGGQVQEGGDGNGSLTKGGGGEKAHGEAEERQRMQQRPDKELAA